MQLEKWLDRHLGVLEDEVELSPDGRERLYSQPLGITAVPAGEIHALSPTPGGRETEQLYYVTGSVRVGHMTESEVDRSCQLVDERLLNEGTPKYDHVFSEVRTREAQTRYSRVCQIAEKMRELDLVDYEALAEAVAREADS